jgi:23S rRNA (cytosine1962-C5)-methyltransferase
LGVFPEQAPNWDFIYQHARGATLNLFAYTGAATLAARAAGADVTHLDAVKSIVAWAKHNATRNGYDDIRFLTDDAGAFLKREIRRGRRYRGLILDPPAFGTGPKGERWVLEDNLFELLTLARAVFEPPGFLVLNCYSLGLSAMVLENVVDAAFGDVRFRAQAGELFLVEESGGRRLPAGVFFRFSTL